MPDIFTRVPADKRESVSSTLKAVATFCVLPLISCFLFFTISSEEECTGRLWNKECVDVPIPMSERAPWLLAVIALIAIMVTCGWGILRLSSSQAQPQRKYLAILTGIEHMSVQRIAAITDRPPAKVRAEIQGLIDAGELDDFYIDLSSDQVVSKRYVPKTSHKTVVVCRGCGGHNDLIVGITKVCGYCRQPLVFSS